MYRARKKCAVEAVERTVIRCIVLVLLSLSSTGLKADDVDLKEIIHFNIPQQRADIALTQFAEQADLTLVFPYDEVRDRTANRTVGEYSKEDAVENLLAGTGLKPTFTSESVVNIALGSQSEPEGNEMKADKKVRLGAFLASIFTAAGATAQEGPDIELNTIEEIIVTAQKREQNLQDVGASIQALTGDGLARAGIVDVERIQIAVAGLNYGTYGNDAKLALRGTNSNNTFGDNSSIMGMFVDGVYKPRASQQTRAFFDVARLEVLKGPQGTLYGRNTFGGAINLISNAPSLDEKSGEIQLTVGRFDLVRTDGHFNFPVSDDLALRVAWLTNSSSGHVSNDAGQGYGEKDDQSFRLSALWQPTDTFELTARFTSIRDTGTIPGLFAATGVCRPVTVDGITDPLGSSLDCQNPRRGAAGTPSWDFFGAENISQDYVPDADLTEDNFTVHMTWSLDNFDIRSISSYTDYKSLLGGDLDLSAVNFGRMWFEENAESITQELQFVSTGDGALKWTGGLYYSNDETLFQFSSFNIAVDDRSVRPVVTGVPTGIPDDSMTPDDESVTDVTVLDGSPVVDSSLIYNGAFARPQEHEIDTFGAFAQFELAIGDNWRAIAGARYNSEDKSSRDGTTGTGLVTFVQPATTDPIPADPRSVFLVDWSSGVRSVAEKFTKTTYHLGLNYDVSDDILAYTSYSTGFLSGSLSATAVTDQQESEAFEIGLKSRFFNDTLQFNIAAYSNEYKNLATQIQETLPSGQVITTSANGGDIEAQGIEIEAIALLGENLTIDANASFLDAEFGTFGSSNPYQAFDGIANVAGGPASFIDLADGTPPWAPEYTFSMRGSYDFHLANGSVLTPTLQFFASDGYGVSGFNLWMDPSAQQPSYTKTDFRLRWVSPDEDVVLEAFVENIENENVFARNQIGGEDILQTTYLFPRNYGVKIKYRF